MIGLIKLIKNQKISLIFISVILISCSEEVKTKSVPVVKVEESVLTEAELNFYLREKSLNEDYKEEFIRRWIERELLYLESVERKIPSDSGFKRIQSDSKKELASALLLQEIFDTLSIIKNKEEVEKFFEENKSSFVLNKEAYVTNYIKFGNMEEASKFRSNTIKFGWNSALEEIDSTYLLESRVSDFRFVYQVSPSSILRVLQELLPGEVSIVLNMEPDVYMVVQLINYYDRFQLPELKYIYDQVSERLTAEKYSIVYKELLKRLYTKYNVEIMKDSK